ncbi:hypothetical protein TRIATDRAFT_301206 [Trichoderma atroviride IMI 206040]|uniref:F-box domain-containing protein n=1 Tax=Hypocrea atroviridis (strain ATCC 20476 / IMI 206040) TaxID=452589 RepID=G9P1L8_HYPAI|nr:uncharacterized protein TRIATDRAFT_301206 [Trichoderma atroviride IMI 206040]EHK43350.1 hypothetical protein TRIATDRAFT_301206 [Trichoderma atroviride IMI 206040]
MSIIDFFFRYKKGKVSSQPPCHLLQLPVDMLVEILAFLPPYTLLLVYQTCRPLRTIIHQFFLAGRGDILSNATPEDRLLYLTHSSRLQPDRWVCAKCCKLHRIHGEDTPYKSSPRHLSCVDGLDISERYGESKYFAYVPKHRHVQLTLKYTRLENKERVYNKYLLKLLEPYHHQLQEAYWTITRGVEVRFSAYPKVVNGRYLLLSIWTYLDYEIKVSRKSIRYLDICPHYSQREVRQNLHWGAIALAGIERALDTAFAIRGAPMRFSCGSCKTDFSIETSSGRVTICIWQDFGPEGTVFDKGWAAIARDTGALYHRRQSIRQLYGPHNHGGEMIE